MKNMFDIICNKNIVDYDDGGVYKHILNIPMSICREEIIGGNLHFKIIILTDHMDVTKENVMQGIMNSSDFYIDDLKLYKTRNKITVNLKCYKNHGDNVHIEIRNIANNEPVSRGEWCDLIIFDIEDYCDINEYLNEELYARLSVVNKHLYSQMAHDILLYSTKYKFAFM